MGIVIASWDVEYEGVLELPLIAASEPNACTAKVSLVGCLTVDSGYLLPPAH